MIKRCAYCGARVWPWQRRGWVVNPDGKVTWWHGQCWRWRAFQARQHDDDCPCSLCCYPNRRHGPGDRRVHL